MQVSRARFERTFVHRYRRQRHDNGVVSVLLKSSSIILRCFEVLQIKLRSPFLTYQQTNIAISMVVNHRKERFPKNTLMILVSWSLRYTLNSSVLKFHLRPAFYRCYFDKSYSGYPDPRMKRLQFVILPHFHLCASDAQRENGHGFTLPVCIVGPPRRIQTEKRKKETHAQRKRKERKASLFQ